MTCSENIVAQSSKLSEGVRPLDDAELLMLDILIYHVRPEMAVEGATAGELAELAEQVQFQRMQAVGGNPDALSGSNMTFGEWIAILRSIQHAPALRDLVLTAYACDDRDARMGCFVDAADRAYAVFSGTGTGEWMDNCMAGCVPDTEQQKRALTWLSDDVVPQRHAELVVSGHSKGGNKAQYCAIMAGEGIDRAVCFDAEGFAYTFNHLHAEKIEAHRDKIVWYALDRDPVNGLCFPILEQEQMHFLRHDSSRDGADGVRDDAGDARSTDDVQDAENGPAASTMPVNPLVELFSFHAPIAMLERDERASCGWRLRAEGPQDQQGKITQQFMDYMVNHLPPEKFEQFCWGLGIITDNLVPSKKSRDDRRRDLTFAVQTDAFAITVSAYVSFLNSVGYPMTVRRLLDELLPDSLVEGIDKDVLANRVEATGVVTVARDDSAQARAVEKTA